MGSYTGHSSTADRFNVGETANYMLRLDFNPVHNTVSP